MLNTNAHDNARGDPYVTSGPFFPVILQRYIGSRWNLLHKTSFSCCYSALVVFRDHHTFNSCANYEIILLFQPGVLYELPEILYPNMIPMLQSWMRVPRSAPNYPRGSKWINMGIWGREIFVPSYHSIATISHGWMNNIRQGMSTDEKNPGKRNLSLTCQ
jgi:hypothetical protein